MKLTTEELIEKLSYYNRWRKGAEIPMPNPSEISMVINQTIKKLKSIKK